MHRDAGSSHCKFIFINFLFGGEHRDAFIYNPQSKKCYAYWNRRYKFPILDLYSGYMVTGHPLYFPLMTNYPPPPPVKRGRFVSSAW